MRVVRGSEISFVPASHEDPNNPGVLKRVLATRRELLDGRVQMINWAKLPASSQFQSHYHEDMEEIFLILSGRVEMTVDGVSVELARGDAIFVEPREVHSMRNLTDQDVDYIVVGISTEQGGQTVVVPHPN